MTMHWRRETTTSRHPFRIKGIDLQLQAGAYEVITDEEMIEGLSFASFRRIATMIMVPGAAPRTSSMEMISISAIDLGERDRGGGEEQRAARGVQEDLGQERQVEVAPAVSELVDGVIGRGVDPD